MTCPNNIIKGGRENRGKERAGGRRKKEREREKQHSGIAGVCWEILTSASLRTMSTMLPRTTRESNEFQASLK